jgi:hypothetical protein
MNKLKQLNIAPRTSSSSDSADDGPDDKEEEIIAQEHDEIDMDII